MSSLKLSIGLAETKGKRDSMEDKHISLLELAPNISFFGVYDGHGGKNPDNLELAIREAFNTTDNKIIEKSITGEWMNGSTAVIAIFSGSDLYTANVGDSEAALAEIDENGVMKAYPLSVPHKASDDSERERIESLGGHIFFNRVFGALAVSRSFGDVRFKRPRTTADFVSAQPAIIYKKITPNSKFMILACDGLWDALSYQDAVDVANSHFNKGENEDSVARELVTEALSKRSEDNITVMVIRFTQVEEKKD